MPHGDGGTGYLAKVLAQVNTAQAHEISGKIDGNIPRKILLLSLGKNLILIDSE